MSTCRELCSHDVQLEHCVVVVVNAVDTAFADAISCNPSNVLHVLVKVDLSVHYASSFLQIFHMFLMV